jgi:hypothetical protein
MMDRAGDMQKLRCQGPVAGEEQSCAAEPAGSATRRLEFAGRQIPRGLSSQKCLAETLQ